MRPLPHGSEPSAARRSRSGSGTPSLPFASPGVNSGQSHMQQHPSYSNQTPMMSHKPHPHYQQQQQQQHHHQQHQLHLQQQPSQHHQQSHSPSQHLHHPPLQHHLQQAHPGPHPHQVVPQQVSPGQAPTQFIPYSGPYYSPPHHQGGQQGGPLAAPNAYGHVHDPRPQLSDHSSPHAPMGLSDQAVLDVGGNSETESIRPTTARSDSMSSSSIGEMPSSAAVGPQYLAYSHYSPYYPPGTSSSPSPFHQPPPQSHMADGPPMLQSAAHPLGVQPLTTYVRYAYGNLPQIPAYGPQSFAPIYMTGRPSWQPIHAGHYAQQQHAPPAGIPQTMTWRPGLNLVSLDAGSRAPLLPGHHTYGGGRSPAQPKYRSSTVPTHPAWQPHMDVLSPRRGAKSLPHRPTHSTAAASGGGLEGAGVGSGPGVVRGPAVSGAHASRRGASSQQSQQPGKVVSNGTTAELSSAAAGLELGDASTPSADAHPKLPGRGLRPHYHPQQGPRSDFVLWCGNVPHDATVEELWSLFTQLPVDEVLPTDNEVAENSAGADVVPNAGVPSAGSSLSPAAADEGRSAVSPTAAASQSPTEHDASLDRHGVLSVFVISRSNCAFINYATARHLERACRYFQGQSLRPHDPRCPKLVCRVRKKDDEAQAGVLGQRGRGVHVSWLQQQKEADRKKRAADGTAPTAAAATAKASLSSGAPTAALSPPKAAIERPSGLPQENSSSSYSSSGSVSFTSTNSSLFRHPAFRNRFFILKSLRQDDLARSVVTGLWATQPHNEAVLDQAYRNSENVYLIFSVNESGEFFGFARMAGPIQTGATDARDAAHSPQAGSVRDASVGEALPTAVPKEEAEGQGRKDTLPLPSAHVTEASPLAEGSSDTVAPSSPTQSRSRLPPAFSSPLPLTPTKEEERKDLGFASTTDEEGLQTPKNVHAGSTAQSQTWPSTTKANTSTAADQTLDSGPGNSPDPASGSSHATSKPTMRTMFPHRQTQPDEQGVRRVDMAGSMSPRAAEEDSSALGPNDSASWSSAESRFAEQVAMRAVIHNLRLDERESRGKANILESQLDRATDGARRASDDTDKAAEGQADGASTAQPRAASSDSWGKPFKVEWIKTVPLSFHRVRKLRNPWRDNRQVKVSRDGTELEPDVGMKILAEWETAELAAPITERKGRGRQGDAAHAASPEGITEEDE